MIPNLFRLLAHSPDALKGVADLHGGLGKSLGARTRARIHIMTAEVNGCDYSLTTHTYLAGKLTPTRRLISLSASLGGKIARSVRETRRREGKFVQLVLRQQRVEVSDLLLRAFP